MSASAHGIDVTIFNQNVAEVEFVVAEQRLGGQLFIPDVVLHNLSVGTCTHQVVSREEVDVHHVSLMSCPRVHALAHTGQGHIYRGEIDITLIAVGIEIGGIG